MDQQLPGQLHSWKLKVKHAHMAAGLSSALLLEYQNAHCLICPEKVTWCLDSEGLAFNFNSLPGTRCRVLPPHLPLLPIQFRHLCASSHILFASFLIPTIVTANSSYGLWQLLTLSTDLPFFMCWLRSCLTQWHGELKEACSALMQSLEGKEKNQCPQGIPQPVSEGNSEF